MITLVLGGARSGKSAIAEALAGELGDDVVYLATAVVTDSEFAARVDRHRERRPATWSTDECGAALPAALRRHAGRPVLVDSIGAWVAATPDFKVDLTALVEALSLRTAATVLVAEEAGLGVHPESEVGRRWRDAVGETNQALALAADAVVFVLAGRVMRL